MLIPPDGRKSTYCVCKDFPRESSFIGWDGPVEGGMTVVR